MEEELIDGQFCIACGMPLEKPEDHALGDEKSPFCLYCVDEKGNVKTCEEIFEGGVEFFMGVFQGTRDQAEKLVRKNMQFLPYWQDKDEEILHGEIATDEEFAELMKRLDEMDKEEAA